MAKSKRSTKKTVAKTTNTNTNTTTAASNELVRIEPMVPRQIPLLSIIDEEESARASLTETVVIQYCGREISNSDILARVRQAYAESGETAEITSITSYVKPEENKIYYVINDNFTGALDF